MRKASKYNFKRAMAMPLLLNIAILAKSTGYPRDKILHQHLHMLLLSCYNLNCKAVLEIHRPFINGNLPKASVGFGQIFCKNAAFLSHIRLQNRAPILALAAAVVL